MTADFDPLNPETDRKIVSFMVATIAIVTLISLANHFWFDQPMVSYQLPGGGNFYEQDCAAIGGVIRDGACVRVLN